MFAAMVTDDVVGEIKRRTRSLSTCCYLASQDLIAIDVVIQARVRCINLTPGLAALGCARPR
jgi:hypothetical protein